MEPLLNVLLFHVAEGLLKAACLQRGQAPGFSLSRSCGVGSHAEGQAGPGHLLPTRPSDVGSGQAQPVRRLGGEGHSHMTPVQPLPPAYPLLYLIYIVSRCALE